MIETINPLEQGLKRTQKIVVKEDTTGLKPLIH